ncbi:DUF2982 domain-containing protein [Colwellia sp. MB02u-6]|jgi:hypothetical protein|uniref:DUF2982 domain-containing protein n=1 Tax=Colwellia sp. MB02u-6 TaxID=2759824 RepID=UPI0015F6B6E0|nr:DUF2982 domain-containing protein [Colwellia sp. MB02u-6]MBA6328842.1 DUF2982 domain-containing protein [Colwellia sp. MB02u-6]
MKKNNNVMKIKAVARHHGLFITLTGFIALFIMAWLCSYYWQQARFPLMFMVLACLVTIFIGLLKLAEPTYSLILTAETLTFHHRHGRWQLNWQQIRNLHCVSNTVGINREELNYVGIKLSSIDSIADNISLRLANRMIHEQKPLIHYCIKHQLLTFEQGILNFEPYVLKDGSIIKGPLAAFLHHSEVLHHALGAHLFIAASNLNGPMEDFVVLANTYLANAKEAYY